MSFPYLHLQQEQLRWGVRFDGYFFANILGAASQGNLAGLPLETKIQETPLISKAPWVKLTRYVLEHRIHEVNHLDREAVSLQTSERIYRFSGMLKQEETIEMYAHYKSKVQAPASAPFYSTVEYRLDTPHEQELAKYKQLPSVTILAYQLTKHTLIKQWELRFHPHNYSFSLWTLKLEIAPTLA